MKHNIKQFSFDQAKLNESIDVKITCGTVHAIAIYVDGAKPSVPVNVAIKTGNGVTIMELTHYSELVRSTAANTFKDSLRPVNFKEKDIIVEFYSKEALGDDFKGQIQFYSFDETQNNPCNSH